MDNDFFYPIHDIIPDREGHGMVIGKNGSLRCIHFTRMNWQHAMLYLYRHSPICLTIVGCISRIFSEVFPSSQQVWGCRIWPNLIRSTFQEGNISSTAV